MQVSVTDAKGQLTELVRRADAGDEIVLTRHGRAAVRLVPIRPMPDAAGRRLLMEDLRRIGSLRAKAGGGTVGSQDDLYHEDSLP